MTVFDFDFFDFFTGKGGGPLRVGEGGPLRVREGGGLLRVGEGGPPRKNLGPLLFLYTCGFRPILGWGGRF